MQEITILKSRVFKNQTFIRAKNVAMNAIYKVNGSKKGTFYTGLGAGVLYNGEIRLVCETTGTPLFGTGMTYKISGSLYLGKNKGMYKVINSINMIDINSGKNNIPTYFVNDAKELRFTFYKLIDVCGDDAEDELVKEIEKIIIKTYLIGSFSDIKKKDVEADVSEIIKNSTLFLTDSLKIVNDKKNEISYRLKSGYNVISTCISKYVDSYYINMKMELKNNIFDDLKNKERILDIIRKLVKESMPKSSIEITIDFNDIKDKLIIKSKIPYEQHYSLKAAITMYTMISKYMYNI